MLRAIDDQFIHHNIAVREHATTQQTHIANVTKSTMK